MLTLSRHVYSNCWLYANYSFTWNLTLIQTKMSDSPHVSANSVPVEIFWSSFTNKAAFMKTKSESRGRVVNTPDSYPGSNLDMEISYSDWDFRGFFSVSPGECRDINLKLRHGHFLPHPFQFIIHTSSLHPTLYSLSYREVVFILTSGAQSGVRSLGAARYVSWGYRNKFIN
jgi:hypothetical protein